VSGFAELEVDTANLAAFCGSWLLSRPLFTGSSCLVCCEQTCVSGLPFPCCECRSPHWCIFWAPLEECLAGCWWELLWTGTGWCHFPQSQNRLYHFSVRSVICLLLGKTVLQTGGLLLLKFFQGKRRKDEQVVLIASN